MKEKGKRLKGKAGKKVVKARVISNREVADDHFLLEAAAPYLGKNSSPGQFVMVKARDKGTDPLLRIPLGVHAIKKSGISLLYKVVGTATELLSAKKAGDEIDILGPLGNAFETKPALGKRTVAVLVAGGHGVAPLYALAAELARKKKKIDCYIGAGTKRHVVCARELKKLGARVHVATEDGTQGHKGYVTDLLKKHLELNTRCPGPDTVIYACGPRPMLAELARITSSGKSETQVSLDAYMACGTGACLGCAVRTKQGYKMVCKDGPVFDIEEIDWQREGA